MDRGRAAISLVMVLVFAAAWLLLGPTQLGGRATYVATHGISMEPGFQTGDLAIAFAADTYRVGDVAVYRSDMLDTLVMHRIVATDGDGFVLQGDNNSWLDPERPTADDMVGALAFRVPQGGVWLDRLTSAPALGGLSFLLFGTGGAVVHLRRRRRPVTLDDAPPRRRRRDAPAPPRTRAQRPDRSTDGRSPRPPARRAAPASSHGSVAAALRASHLVAAAIGTLLLGGLLAAVTFGRPLLAPGPVEYGQHATFGYTADAPTGAVYADGTVVTGDTVFLELVDRVELSLDWQLDPPADHPVAVAGTGSLWVEISDGSGWQRTLPIGAPQPIDGTDATLAGTLDLRRIQALVGAAQAETGSGNGTQTLRVTADLDLTGQVAGQPIEESFAPEVSFTLDALRLQPPAAADTTAAPDPALEAGANADAAATASSPFTTTTSGSVTVADLAPAAIEVLGHPLPVEVLRWVAVALLASAPLLAVGALLLDRRDRHRSPAGHIEARYGDRVVLAQELRPAAGRTVVELATIDGLASVAERLELPMVHLPLVDGGSLYAVDDLQTHYRVHTYDRVRIPDQAQAHDGDRDDVSSRSPAAHAGASAAPPGS